MLPAPDRPEEGHGPVGGIMEPVDVVVVTVFGLVYLGMVLGGLPGLALDRTGVALLGAIALLVTERITPQAALAAVDVPTIGLLFGLMIVSAQFRLGGFYAAVARRVALAPVSPRAMLALVIVIAGFLSALLANDIVCLAMTPVLVQGCSRRGLNPIPFLLALACASNVGSAATLIGNPQNMLIGQVLHLSFAGYLADAAIPAVLGLGVVWGVIVWRLAGRWSATGPTVEASAPPFDAWQTAKGLAVLTLLVTGFLFSQWPREVLALGAAGILLASRKMASRAMLSLVDWHLLVLFVALFVVNQCLTAGGHATALVDSAREAGVDLAHPGWLFAGTALLSNVVSNVPAVMLLLPVATHPIAGPLLALSSTLAGNLLIVGSIANIIVVDQAGQLKVRISWREHAAVGVPVTLLTLVIAAAWLSLRAGV